MRTKKTDAKPDSVNTCAAMPRFRGGGVAGPQGRRDVPRPRYSSTTGGEGGEERHTIGRLRGTNGKKKITSSSLKIKSDGRPKSSQTMGGKHTHKHKQEAKIHRETITIFRPSFMGTHDTHDKHMNKWTHRERSKVQILQKHCYIKFSFLTTEFYFHHLCNICSLGGKQKTPLLAPRPGCTHKKRELQNPRSCWQQASVQMQVLRLTVNKRGEIFLLERRRKRCRDAREVVSP